METLSRRESRARRLAWVAVALALTAGPVGFTLVRASSFAASLQIFPGAVGSFPAVTDPAYYLGLLRDPELRREMDRNVGRGVADYADVKIRRDGRALILTVRASTPARAQRFVNALGPQIAGASARQLAADARSRASGLRGELGRRPPPGVRTRLARELRRLERLARTRPHPVVVGARSGLPRPPRWADRVAAAMPGEFPARPHPAAVALAGLTVAAMLWLLALVLAPPAAAPDPRRRLRLSGWIETMAERERRWRARPAPSVAAPVPWWAWAGGATVLLGAGAFVLWVGRGQIFVTDEWAFVLQRRAWNADAFLHPHNEHLMAVPVLVFKGLFATVGLEHYWPYRVTVALAHVACVALVFVIARRRVGWALAALLAAPIVAFGPGFDVILFPINLGFLGSTVAGLGAMLALDREDRRGDLAAALLLAASLMSSTLGVCFASGIAAELLWRRDSWRRAAVVLSPALLFAAWYLGWNLEPTRQGPVEVAQAPEFAFRAAAGTLSALYGAPLGIETFGRGYHRALELLAYAAVAAGAFGLVLRVRRLGRLDARLVMLAMTLASFWLLTGAARAYSHQWYASRYVYPAAVLVLVLVAQACRGLTLSRGTAVLAVPLALGVAAVNAAWLVEDGKLRRADTEILAARLGAVELARATVPPRFPVDEQRALHMSASGYFDAVDELGSPALTPAELEGASPPARVGADSVLAQVAIGARPYDPRARRPVSVPPVGGSAARFARRRERCLDVRPPGRAVSAVVRLPLRGVALLGAGPDTTVEVRRFGPVWVTSRELRDRLPADGLLVAPRDRSPRRWTVRVTSARPFRLC